MIQPSTRASPSGRWRTWHARTRCSAERMPCSPSWMICSLRRASFSLLDVGTGLGDIPARVRARAGRHGMHGGDGGTRRERDARRRRSRWCVASGARGRAPAAHRRSGVRRRALLAAAASLSRGRRVGSAARARSGGAPSRDRSRHSPQLAGGRWDLACVVAAALSSREPARRRGLRPAWLHSARARRGGAERGRCDAASAAASWLSCDGFVGSVGRVNRRATIQVQRFDADAADEANQADRSWRGELSSREPKAIAFLFL